MSIQRYLLLMIVLLGTACLAPGIARADTFEPNDTPQQAKELPSATPVESFISSPTDLDFFFIDAADGAVVISLTSIPSGADYDLAVTDEFGELACDVCISENPGNADEQLNLSASGGGGRFYLLVGAFEGSSDVDGYLLTATYTPLNPQNTPPTVTLSAPNGGESWTAGTTEAITWSASDTEDGSNLNMELEYSTNGGGSWTLITQGLSNTGTFPWSVPDAVSTQARVRVTARDSGGLSTQDQSNANFTIVAGIIPSIALSIPQGLSGQPGGTLQVPVMLATNMPLGGIQFAVTFDGNSLTPQSVSNGNLMGALGIQSNTSLSDEVRIVFYDAGGGAAPEVNGTVCTITFQVKANPPSNPVLGFGDAVASDANGNALTVSTSSAVVTHVRLLSLDLADSDEGVRLVWNAEADADHAGFRVLREDIGPLHAGLLPGDTRAFVDREAVPGTRYRYWLEAISRSGGVQTFGPAEIMLRDRLWASAAYPNPTSGAAAISVRGGSALTSATVLDVRGRLLRRLDTTGATNEVVRWDGRLDSGAQAPAGIYFIRLGSGELILTRRVIRIGD